MKKILMTSAIFITTWSNISYADVWYCMPWKGTELYNYSVRGVSGSEIIMKIEQRSITAKTKINGKEFPEVYNIVSAVSGSLTAISQKANAKYISSLVFNKSMKSLSVANLSSEFSGEIGGSITTYQCSSF